MFALTSGTTAARKYIPVTDAYLRDYQRGWNIWGLRAYRAHLGVRLRPIVQLSGDHDEHRTESGVPCGAVTGLTANAQKRLIRWLYCVPACVGKIKDPLAKYYVALRLSLPRAVGMIIAANPSTVLAMARTGDEHKEALIRDIADGTLSGKLDLPREVRAEVERHHAAAGPGGPASLRRWCGGPGRSTPATTGRRRYFWATGPAAAWAPTCGTTRATSATTPCATSA
jgi:hypothetical protein